MSLPNATANNESATAADEEVAAVLEDFAMGHSLNRERATNRIVTSSQGYSALSPIVASPLSHSSRLSTSPLAFLFPDGFDYTSRAIATLPDVERTWSLITYFFSTAQWYLHIMDEPSFIEECPTVLSRTPFGPAIRPEFLCSLLMVVTVALHFIEPDFALSLGWSMSETRDLGASIFSAAQGVLWASNFLSYHSLESIQAIMLMGTIQYSSEEQADSHWSLLGSAVKIGQNLGISSLGPEAPGKVWPAAWSSFAKREVGRRVWWGMIMLDWSQASAHGNRYCIHPSQNETAIPLNLSDVDLRTRTSSRPITEYTDESFQIFKIHYVVLYRELTDYLAVTPSPSYQFILDMDIKILRVTDSLPAYFKNPSALPASSPLNLVRESILINIVSDNRLMRLHRPYLLRGYKERKYEGSKDRCVASARSILVGVQLAESLAPGMLRFWVALLFAFSAAIVSFIDLTRNPSPELRSLLHQTLASFKSAEIVSAAARNAIVLLKGLLDAEEEIRKTLQRGKKRQRLDGADGAATSGDRFHQIVGRLLAAVVPSPKGGPSSPSGSVHSVPSLGMPSPVVAEYDPTAPHSLLPFAMDTDAFSGDFSTFFDTTSEFPDVFLSEYDLLVQGV